MPPARLKVIMTPVGSSGDVHPYIGIGRALRERGHEVHVITSEPFEHAVKKAGLHYTQHGTREQFELVLHEPDMWHPRKGIRVIFKWVSREMRPLFEHIDQLYEPGRSVIVGHTLALASRVYEEAKNAAAVTLQLAPIAFRSEYQLPHMHPARNWAWTPRWFKRGAWWVADRFLIDPHIAPALNAWRTELGLPPVRRIFNDYPHSPNLTVGLFPRWFAPSPPDWPTQVKLTGFPLFDEAGQHEPNEQLDAFLEKGEPPLAFAPGSANAQAGAFFQAAVAAAKIMQRRALLFTKFDEQIPADLPAGVMHVRYAPFSQVLPRCAALIHHGGIGTCAQALAAGIPQCVTPLSFDQPDNAAHLARLGVGTWVMPRKLTGQRLADTLTPHLHDPQVAVACRTYKEKIAESNAVTRTCELIEDAAAT